MYIKLFLCKTKPLVGMGTVEVINQLSFNLTTMGTLGSWRLLQGLQKGPKIWTGTPSHWTRQRINGAEGDNPGSDME